jgi:hypothetical protein
MTSKEKEMSKSVAITKQLIVLLICLTAGSCGGGSRLGITGSQSTAVPAPGSWVDGAAIST